MAQQSDNLMALIWATDTSNTNKQSVSTTTGWLWGFNVFDEVNKEKEYKQEVKKKSLVNHLKQRSELRKAIVSWEKTTGNKEKDTKTVKSSELVDGATQVLIELWKTPEDMEKYTTSEWNMEMINKLKSLQGWKFSWDIQNYIDWKSDKDLTWIMTAIFPEYMWAKAMWIGDEEVSDYDPLKDTSSGWEKFKVWAAHTPIVWDVINFWAWAWDKLRKQVAWVQDWFEEWTPNLDEYEANKGYDWTNMVDEDSASFQAGWLWAEIWEQVLLDKWLWTLLSPLVKVAGKTKRWSKLIQWWEELLKDKKWLKDWLEWAKAWAEMQFIWDAEEWDISDFEDYLINMWISWGIWWILWWLTNKLWPDDRLTTSLWKIDAEDTKAIVNYAKTAAKDWTLPSATQRTRDITLKEATDNIKSWLSEVWGKLWEFRKNLKGWNIWVKKDFVDNLNTSLTKKWVWGQIVKWEWWMYKLEWESWNYKWVLENIVDNLNSMQQNIINKQKLVAKWDKTITFDSELTKFEDMVAKTRRAIYDIKDKQTQQGMLSMMEDIENKLYENMSEADAELYKQLRNDYHKLKTQESKLDDLWKKMVNPSQNDNQLYDWQYMADFMKELEWDNLISESTANKRIVSLYADTFYWKPIREEDKLLYPSLPWLYEWILKTVAKPFQSPTWVNKRASKSKNYRRNWKEKASKRVKEWVVSKIAEQWTRED